MFIANVLMFIMFGFVVCGFACPCLSQRPGWVNLIKLTSYQLGSNHSLQSNSTGYGINPRTSRADRAVSQPASASNIEFSSSPFKYSPSESTQYIIPLLTWLNAGLIGRIDRNPLTFRIQIKSSSVFHPILGV